MNKARVVAILRELIEAIEEDEPKRQKPRKVVPIAGSQPSKEQIDRVRRNLRNKGIAV